MAIGHTSRKAMLASGGLPGSSGKVSGEGLACGLYRKCRGLMFCGAPPAMPPPCVSHRHNARQGRIYGLRSHFAWTLRVGDRGSVAGSPCGILKPYILPCRGFWRKCSRTAGGGYQFSLIVPFCFVPIRRTKSEKTVTAAAIPITIPTIHVVSGLPVSRVISGPIVSLAVKK